MMDVFFSIFTVNHSHKYHRSLWKLFYSSGLTVFPTEKPATAWLTLPQRFASAETKLE